MPGLPTYHVGRQNLPETRNPCGDGQGWMCSPGIGAATSCSSGADTSRAPSYLDALPREGQAHST